MKKIFLLSSLSLSYLGVAQNKDVRIPNYSKVPYWIEMIKNPNVNYYDAVTAYDEFWKERKKPLEDGGLLTKDTGRLSTADKRERILYLKYVAECKKFEAWKNTVKPLVQPDGRISSRSLN